MHEKLQTRMRFEPMTPAIHSDSCLSSVQLLTMKGTNLIGFHYSRLLTRTPPFTVEVSLGTIYRVEKIGGTTSRGENAYGLELYCKVNKNFLLTKSEVFMGKSQTETLLY